MKRALWLSFALGCACTFVAMMVVPRGTVESVAYAQSGSSLQQLKSGQLVGWSTSADGSVAGDLFMGRSGIKQMSVAAASALTNPVLQVDQATGSAITGVKVTSAASGSGISLSALGGTNENLNLASRGTTSYVMAQGGSWAVDIGPAAFIRTWNSGQYVWSSTGNAATASADTGLSRIVAGVVGVTKGDSGSSGWIQNTAGRSRMTTSPTNATAAMSNLTDLSQTLIAGRKYTGRLVIFAKNSTAAEGLQFDFNGGAATMTSVEFGFAATPPGSGLSLGTLTSTAIATPLTATTATTADAVYTIQFGCVCNVGGTIIPRFAEVSHTNGTATVELNSFFHLDDSAN